MKERSSKGGNEQKKERTKFIKFWRRKILNFESTKIEFKIFYRLAMRPKLDPNNFMVSFKRDFNELLHCRMKRELKQRC